MKTDASQVSYLFFEKSVALEELLADLGGQLEVLLLLLEESGHGLHIVVGLRHLGEPVSARDEVVEGRPGLFRGQSARPLGLGLAEHGGDEGRGLEVGVAEPAEPREGVRLELVPGQVLAEERDDLDLGLVRGGV